jgi:hypothetical protein
MMAIGLCLYVFAGLPFMSLVKHNGPKWLVAALAILALSGVVLMVLSVAVLLWKYAP